MLARRAALQHALLFEFLAPSAVRCRIHSRSLHGDVREKPLRPEPTPEERDALFNSLRRIVKDRRYDAKLTNNQIDDFHRDLQLWRAGMLTGDLAAVVETMRRLKEKRLVGLITQRDWKELSYFVNSALEPTRGDTTAQPELVDLAMDAASAEAGGTGEAAFALKKIMLARFRARDYNGLLELYNRFISEARAAQSDLQRRAGVQARSPEPDEEPDVAEDAAQAHTYLQFSPGVLELHLCALAAYHALGAFQQALDAVVGVQIRFTPTTITNFCASAYGNGEQAAAFTIFVENVKLARIISRPMWLALEAKRLQDAHDSQRLLALYDSVVHACRSSPAWFNTTAGEPSSAPLPLTLKQNVWAAFLHAFTTMRLLKYVHSAWAEMSFQRVQPNQALWNAFLLAHANCGQFGDALEIWREMVDLGVLDIASYSIMTKAYISAGLVNDAVQLCEHLERVKWRTEAGQPAPESSRLQVYNILIDGLLRAPSKDGEDNFARAEALLEKIQKKGPKPSIYTHNAFLHYYARAGDVPAAATRLRTIAQAGFTPDAASFTIILQALLKANHPNPTKTVLDLVRAFGLKPETSLYSTILATIMGTDGEKHVLQAFTVLDVMESSDQAKPDERAYSIVLAGLFRQRSLEPQRRAELEAELQRRMVRAQISLSHLSYNHIICACLEPAALPTVDMLDTGLRYYNEMIRRGAMPNNKAWTLVLSTMWTEKRDMRAALEVVDTMRIKCVVGDHALRKLVERVQRDSGMYAMIPKYSRP